MRGNSLRLRRRLLAMQIAALMSVGVVSGAQADDHDDYYGTGNSNVALTGGQISDSNPCPPVPCEPGVMPYYEGSIQPMPESGSIMSDGGQAAPLSSVPSSIPQSELDSFNTGSGGNTLARASASGSSIDVPNMIGDFTGGNLLAFQPLIGDPYTLSVAGGDRRFKIPENVSPVPQDRVFFNYNHFHNAVSDIDGDVSHIDRMLFGIEKTFLNGNASAEFRLPFAAALDGTQVAGANNEAVEFGNLGFALKFNLLSGADWLISSGALLTVPTGTDANYGAFAVENESYQLAPFLGFVKQYGRDWFLQGFAQMNFDLNGYEVTVGGVNAGQLQEQHLLFLDLSLGRWLYRCDNACGLQRGIAAITELHYTTAMNDSDNIVVPGGNLLNAAGNNFDILNATGALHFQNGVTSLRVGGAAPLRDDFDRMFDAEFFIQINRFF